MTLVRLVSNSSFQNGKTSLNTCLAKGPNTLNDLYDNLIKFRGYKVAVASDISKAYNSLYTGLVERHTIWFWMRFSPDEEWVVYGMDRVQFGDKPAAALMSIAVKKAADKYPVL